MFGEPCLDLAELDPEAPDLYLKIVAAQVFNDPVGPKATKIPGQVEPFTRHEWVGDEPLRRQLRPIEIAPATCTPPM